jgi:hypothetical protein
VEVEHSACVLFILPCFEVILDDILLESVNVSMGLEEVFRSNNVLGDELTDSSDAWEIGQPAVRGFSVVVLGGAETFGEGRVASVLSKKPNKDVSGDGLSQFVELVVGSLRYSAAEMYVG